MQTQLILIIGLLLMNYAISNGQSISGDPSEKAGYRLIWHDEFNELGEIDTTVWSFEHGFKRNQELQWYQRENASLGNGVLTIVGRREKIKNPAFDPASDDWRRNRAFAEYSSSSLNTRGKQTFLYGVIEVRAKIDTVMGLWPAIWTLGVSKKWPANGEVDIMEFYRVNGKGTILANAAWAQKGKHGPIWDNRKIPLDEFFKKDSEWSEKFHEWKMDWTPDYIRIYLDDELLNEIDLSRTINPDGFNPFHQPHYILLNLAIGGNGGDPDNTLFPRKYEIDYVRVYQKNGKK